MLLLSLTIVLYYLKVYSSISTASLLGYLIVKRDLEESLIQTEGKLKGSVSKRWEGRKKKKAVEFYFYYLDGVTSL